MFQRLCSSCFVSASVAGLPMVALGETRECWSVVGSSFWRLVQGVESRFPGRFRASGRRAVECYGDLVGREQRGPCLACNVSFWNLSSLWYFIFPEFAFASEVKMRTRRRKRGEMALDCTRLASAVVSIPPFCLFMMNSLHPTTQNMRPQLEALEYHKCWGLEFVLGP